MISIVGGEPVFGKLLEIRIVDGENIPSFLVQIEPDRCEDIFVNNCIDIQEFEMREAPIGTGSVVPRIVKSHPLQFENVLITTSYGAFRGKLIDMSFGCAEIEGNGGVQYFSGDFAMQKV